MRNQMEYRQRYESEEPQDKRIEEAAREIKQALSYGSNAYLSDDKRQAMDSAAADIAAEMSHYDAELEPAKDAVRDAMQPVRERAETIELHWPEARPGTFEAFIQRDHMLNDITVQENRIMTAIENSSYHDLSQVEIGNTAYQIRDAFLRANEASTGRYSMDVTGVSTYDDMALLLQHNDHDAQDKKQSGTRAFMRYQMRETQAAVDSAEHLSPQASRALHNAVNTVADHVADTFMRSAQDAGAEQGTQENQQNAVEHAQQQIRQAQEAFQHLLQDTRTAPQQEQYDTRESPQPEQALSDLAQSNHDTLTSGFPDRMPTSPISMETSDSYREFTSSLEEFLAKQDLQITQDQVENIRALTARVDQEAGKLDDLKDDEAPEAVLHQQALKASNAGLRLESYARQILDDTLHHSSDQRLPNPAELYPNPDKEVKTALHLAQYAQMAEDYIGTLDAGYNQYRSAIRGVMSDVEDTRAAVQEIFDAGHTNTPIEDLDSDLRDLAEYRAAEISSRLERTEGIPHHLDANPENNLPLYTSVEDYTNIALSRYLTDVQDYLARYQDDMDPGATQVIGIQLDYIKQQIEGADEVYAKDSHTNQMTRGLSQTLEAARPAA